MKKTSSFTCLARIFLLLLQSKRNQRLSDLNIYHTIAMEIQQLSYSYPRQSTPVFSDFNLTFSPGKIYGLLGPNGAGKSTLLYIMAGLLAPQTGQATLDGVNVRRRKPSTMCEIFLVPDEFELPNVSLLDYVKTNSVFYPRFSLDDMNAYLRTFGMTNDVRLSALSLGQRKKIFMAFAMATHAKVLLMDEPTNGLDITSKQQFRDFIRQGSHESQLIVISTHQVKDVESILNHVLLMDRSEIIRNEAIDGTIDLETYFIEATKGREAHHD